MEERVKIITPGTCDYFRKITIPSSLGDDTGEYAPQNGAYRNALVEYAANGAIYIYSSDGIYTKINSTGGGSYELPIASSTVLGGIKVGQNLTIAADGVLSASGGGGEIKVLTSADYNWNSVAEDDTTTPFDSIALWLLDTGTYQWDPSIVETYFNVGEAVPLNDVTQLVTFTIGKEETRTVEGTTAQFSPIFMVVLDSQSDFDKIYIGEKVAVAGQTFINTSELVEHILNKAEDYVQYVITYGNGAPSSSTIGTIGRLYEDKTNGKLYICTSSGGGAFTWTEVGASGVELTMSTTDIGEGVPLPANTLYGVYE